MKTYSAIPFICYMQIPGIQTYDGIAQGTLEFLGMVSVSEINFR